jgi:hypothetical protein
MLLSPMVLPRGTAPWYCPEAFRLYVSSAATWVLLAFDAHKRCYLENSRPEHDS